jgi:hypothetical protein
VTSSYCFWHFAEDGLHKADLLPLREGIRSASTAQLFWLSTTQIRLFQLARSCLSEWYHHARVGQQARCSLRCGDMPYLFQTQS